MKILKIFLLCLLAMCFTVSAFAANAKKIAVMPFTTGSEARYGSAATYATGVMMSELQKSSDYTLLERTNMDKLIAEQALSKTGAVSEQSVIQAGMMLGADYMLFGSVDAKSKKSSGFHFFVKAESENTAIELTARIVDTRTGEIVSTVAATGKKHSGTSVKLDLAGLPETALLASGLNISQSIDDATAGAVRDGVKKLVWEFNRKRPLYATVVEIDGKNIYISAGENQGVSEGDEFAVIDNEKVITDPDTGEVIQVIESYHEKIKVKSTEGNVSICKGGKNISLRAKVKRILED